MTSRDCRLALHTYRTFKVLMKKSTVAPALRMTPWEGNLAADPGPIVANGGGDIRAGQRACRHRQYDSRHGCLQKQ